MQTGNIAFAAPLVIWAITLNISQTFETPKEEIIEETPASVETPNDAKEKITALPVEKEQTTESATNPEPVKTLPIEAEPIVVPDNEATNTAPLRRKYSPPKLGPSEINNIETIEAFLEVVKDDPKAY